MGVACGAKRGEKGKEKREEKRDFAKIPRAPGLDRSRSERSVLRNLFASGRPVPDFCGTTIDALARG